MATTTHSLAGIARRRRGIPRRRVVSALAVLVTVAATYDSAAAQTCVGDCDGNGMVAVNELVLGVNIALDAQPLADCASLDDGQGGVGIDRLIVAVDNALSGCGADATPGTPTPTATPASGTATATMTQSPATPTVTQGPATVTMWIVDMYDVTSSDCAGVIEDSVVDALESRGPDFTVRRVGDRVEVEDSNGVVLDGTVDPDGTVHVQDTISDSVVTCDYDVGVDASANLDQSPTTAIYNGHVNFSGFCLGFSDCSLEITSRWRRVEGS
jgi:hypothetical protein